MGPKPSKEALIYCCAKRKPESTVLVSVDSGLRRNDETELISGALEKNISLSTRSATFCASS
jgi:hypothetical protein